MYKELENLTEITKLNRTHSTARACTGAGEMSIVEYFYTDKDKIEIGIPLHNKAISVFLSGGPDSAITTYMVIKSIKDLGFNNPVYPITSEFMARPYNIKYAWNVLRKIEELLDFKFERHLIFPMPNHTQKITDDDKKDIMSDYIKNYFQRYDLWACFNGLTANPPANAIIDTEFAQRQIERENISDVLEKLSHMFMQYPFLFAHKQITAYFFKKFDLLESLFPITRSCEAELEETHYFTKTCFDVRKKEELCWWCQERKWGFEQYRSNDFIQKR